jgi:hypothetical protein
VRLSRRLKLPKSTPNAKWKRRLKSKPNPDKRLKG